MYPNLLATHGLIRWMVLTTLLVSIFTAYCSFSNKKPLTAGANALRHWTATLIQIQLTIGSTLYMLSPIVKYVPFFKSVHAGMMLLAVIVVTIGSAKSKSMSTDKEKYQIMFR